jgi:hypothetical protein
VQRGRAINSIVISRDNKMALCGSGDYTGEDNLLSLWDLDSTQCIRTFIGHERAVNSVCFSADGQRALSGSSDNIVRLWDVGTGECLQIFEGHERAVNSVCLSADGRNALSGGFDQSLRLWNVRDGQCLRTFEGHNAAINSVCFSPDGRYAFSGSEDETIKVWILDWELVERPGARWDEKVKPWLEAFLRTHFQSTGMPSGIERGDRVENLRIKRSELRELLYDLGCAGFGWLPPKRIVRELKAMVSGGPGSATPRDHTPEPAPVVSRPAEKRRPSSGWLARFRKRFTRG